MLRINKMHLSNLTLLIVFLKQKYQREQRTLCFCLQASLAVWLAIQRFMGDADIPVSKDKEAPRVSRTHCARKHAKKHEAMDQLTFS